MQQQLYLKGHFNTKDIDFYIMAQPSNKSSHHLDHPVDIDGNIDQKSLWDIAQYRPPHPGASAAGNEGNSERRRILPTADSLKKARESLLTHLPFDGKGFNETRNHLFQDIVPGLNDSSISPTYYGFVTGGTTPAALLADNIVSSYDQNVQVHLVDHSVATDVEAAALGLFKDLLALDREDWPHATFTTGATASNILGLSCGREFVLRKAVERKKEQSKADGSAHGINGSVADSVGEYGVTAVLEAAGLRGLQVLSTLPHSSLGKAAGMLGIGRANVKSISDESVDATSNGALKFDFERLERELAKTDMASIVAVSCGEINTGRFATGGSQEFKRLRDLCDRYGAWLHVDGAFGIYGRILEDGPEFGKIKEGAVGVELADSITGDAHKFLNVPYDCGFFFSRHGSIAGDVFQNPNAAYLSAGGSGSNIPSPNNIGIENSRRFRALPVYSSLVAYGKSGYRYILEKHIRLARLITGWLFDHPDYIVFPNGESKEELLEQTYMIVLFRAKSESLNKELSKKINGTSRMFVSGTKWGGEAACRIAISNWKIEVERDFLWVKETLEGIIV